MMIRSKLTLKAPILGIALAACATTASTQAAVMADYQFTGGSFTSSDTNAETTASAFTMDANASIASDTVFRNNSPALPKTPASGIGAGLYTGSAFHTWSVTVGAGQTLDLTNLTFDLSIIHDHLAGVSLGVSTAAVGWGSYDPDADFIQQVEFSAHGGGPTAINGNDFDLSSIASFGAGDVVEFRMYLKQGGQNEAVRSIAVDNIVLNGTTTAVPEPSAATLLGLGGLALVLRRRK